MKQLYELLIYPITVIENPILDLMFLTILGYISFVIAWNFVGKTGIQGILGSIVHWTIRIIVMVVLSISASVSLV